MYSWSAEICAAQSNDLRCRHKSPGVAPSCATLTSPHAINMELLQRQFKAKEQQRTSGLYHPQSVAVSSRWDTLPLRLLAVQSDKGTPSDKLRAALVYLLTCESLPSDSEYEQISSTLQVTSKTLPGNIEEVKGAECRFKSWSACPNNIRHTAMRHISA